MRKGSDNRGDQDLQGWDLGPRSVDSRYGADSLEPERRTLSSKSSAPGYHRGQSTYDQGGYGQASYSQSTYGQSSYSQGSYSRGYDQNYSRGYDQDYSRGYDQDYRQGQSAYDQGGYGRASYSESTYGQSSYGQGGYSQDYRQDDKPSGWRSGRSNEHYSRHNQDYSPSSRSSRSQMRSQQSQGSRPSSQRYAEDWIELASPRRRAQASRGRGGSGQVSRPKALLTIAALSLGLVVFSVYLAATYLKGGLVQTAKPDLAKQADNGLQGQAPSPIQVPQSSRVRNILLMGTDMRNEEITAKIGERADSMILLSLDLDKRTVKLCSFQRDMLVEMAGSKNLARLNVAYLNGAGQLIDTINQNFGLNLSDYVSIQMPGLTRVVDLMKGLEIEVPDSAEVIQELNRCILEQNEELGVNYSLIDKPGLQRMDGGQVLAYCRMRKLDSDYERSRRQREVLALIFKKFKSYDPVSQAAIIREALSHVQTNLNSADLLELAQNASLFRSEEIAQSYMPPAEWSWTDDNYNILANMPASAQVLHQFLYGQSLASKIQLPEIPGAPKVAHDPAIWIQPDSESFIPQQAPFIEGGIEAARRIQQEELERQRQAGYIPYQNN